MKSEIKSIRLLVDENEGKVWRTFEGKWLVGSSRGPSSEVVLGWPAKSKGGDSCDWAVIRAKSGKLVVYVQNFSEESVRIEVYDSFEAMEKEIPAEVANEAARAAGIRPEPAYPEEPLDV